MMPYGFRETVYAELAQACAELEHATALIPVADITECAFTRETIFWYGIRLTSLVARLRAVVNECGGKMPFFIPDASEN